MALKVERSMLKRIVQKHESDPLTTDLRDEMDLFDLIDLKEVARELPNLKTNRVNLDNAFSYGIGRLPTFMGAKFAKIGGSLLRHHSESKAPSISWTVIEHESWAVGTLAAMQVVDAVAQAQGYETLLETANGKGNTWHLPQWMVQLSFREP